MDDKLLHIHMHRTPHTHYWWSFQINCIFLVQLVVEFNQKEHIDIDSDCIENRQFKQSTRRVLLRFAPSLSLVFQVKPRQEIRIFYCNVAGVTSSRLFPFFLPTFSVCLSESDCQLSVTNEKTQSEHIADTRGVEQRTSREADWRQGNDQKESCAQHLLYSTLRQHTEGVILVAFPLSLALLFFFFFSFA